MGDRRGALTGFVAAAAVLAVASTAAACVTFIGKVEVEGDDGTTEVVGTGNSHGYCSDGRPTTAAAGHLDDPIKIKVKPGKCNDAGALANHQLPAGTYQVRVNNEEAYTFDGTYWNMHPQLGCFHPANADTASVIGTFDINAAGHGVWSGSFGADDLKGAPYFASVSTRPETLARATAMNICIGAAGKGMLAPYRLLAI